MRLRSRHESETRIAGPTLAERISSLSERTKATLVGVVIAIVAVAVLYAPLQSLYSAWRINGLRAEELAAINETNDGYLSDIEGLQTREGIEDAARDRGYVTEGETPLVIENLPEETAEEEAELATSDPWYVALGDFIFGYKPE